MAYRNKEDERENRRIYHLKNREHLIAVARKWNLEHPERVLEIRAAYKARQKKRREAKNERRASFQNARAGI